MNLNEIPFGVLFLKPSPQISAMKMAKAPPSTSLSFFIFMLLSLCSSGTELGFSIDARESTSASSLSKTLSSLELNKVSASRIRVLLADVRVLSQLSNSGVSVDLYLNENLVKNFTASRSSAVSWLKTHVVSVLPHVNIKSITLKGSNDLSKLLSSLKLIHSAVRSFRFDHQVKVSVAFSLELLENLSRVPLKNLHKVLGFIRKTRSFVIVEGGSDDSGVKHGKLDSFFKSKLGLNDVDVVLTVKGPLDPSKNELAELRDELLKSAENCQSSGRIVELYVEVEQNFPSFRRELLKNSEIVSHDTVIIPPDNSTPNVVTIPATNPATVTPSIPASTPLPIPSTTPSMVPPPSPINPPAPVTNPATTPAPVTVPGGQPITNPVTTYPAPPQGNLPVTNPVAPPATTNAPASPGQSWCVAKTGVSESVLQSALDYACGIGGTDCSQIQQGGSCYNPNTLQNHASFAFNSYYQKNPVATSCDFGGAASLVSTNPSTGSCIFPSSSSSTSPSSTPTFPAPTTPNANPATTPTPTNPATTPSPTNPATTPTNPVTTPTNPATTPITTNPATTPATPVAGDSGFVTPPSVLNSSSPSSDFGSESPPGIGLNSSPSKISLQPVISWIIMVTFLFTTTGILDM